jgi:hypothetical protein
VPGGRNVGFLFLSRANDPNLIGLFPLIRILRAREWSRQHTSGYSFV